ncbi:MAG: O-antigen ligase family protein [Elusimicrobiota bacterium]
MRTGTKLLLLVPYLAALNGINLKIFGLNVRLDQLANLILLCFLVIDMLLGAKRIYIDKVGKLILLFFTWSFIISYFNAPDRFYSMMQTFNLLSAALIYFVMVNFIDSQLMLDKFFKHYLKSGILFSSLGVVGFIIAYLGYDIQGINLTDDLSVAYGVYSTMREPNVFGSYCLIYFILSFTLMLNRNSSIEKISRTLILLTFISTGIGVLLSFTRGVWISAFVCIIAIYILSKRSFRFIKIEMPYRYIFLITIVLFLLVSNFVSSFFLSYKLDNIIDYQSGTGGYRLLVWTDAINNISQNPLFGYGTYSFASFFPTKFIYGEVMRAWIGNLYLTILHDTGLIGSFIFIGFITIILKRSFKNIKKIEITNPDYALIIFGLSFALISILISFIFTTALSYVYSWMVIGLLSVYLKYFRNNLNIKPISVQKHF